MDTIDNETTPHTASSPASDGLLANKVAFVTGAGRGIGAAAARLFARASYSRRVQRRS